MMDLDVSIMEREESRITSSFVFFFSYYSEGSKVLFQIFWSRSLNDIEIEMSRGQLHI